MDFLIEETKVENQNGSHIATLKQTYIMREDEMSLGIGDSFKLTKNPISRTTLALFAGASGDHNPIHIDLDFVKRLVLMMFLHMACLVWLTSVNFLQIISLKKR